MRVYISVDGEGATGVVTPGEMYPGRVGYEFGRKMMTLDANAAVEGACEGGAEEVLVNDAHWSMDNILLENLDPRADLIRGAHKPLGMLEGIEAGFDAAFFVGYHARAGDSDGVGNETVWGREVVAVRMNGVPVGEAELNALVAGYFGVPVVMVSGDDAFAREIRETLPLVETAVVKEHINRFSARCLPPERAHKELREAARRALANLDDHKPYIVDGPIELETEFMSTIEATAASIMPGTVRKSPRVVAYTSDDVVEARQGLSAMQTLGTTASDEIYG
jgi:D-amino peptidase